MGKALQIRVSAVTWDDTLPTKLWPELMDLAETIPSSEAKLGVVELVYRLYDGLQFMKWSEKRVQTLGDNIQLAMKTTKELEAALADWDPRKANTLSDALEDVLHTLEKDFAALPINS